MTCHYNEIIIKKRCSRILTIDAGKVGPVQHRRIKGRYGGDVEEQVSSIGGVTDGIGEKVHLQERLYQVPQHLCFNYRGNATPLLYMCSTLSLFQCV